MLKSLGLQRSLAFISSRVIYSELFSPTDNILRTGLNPAQGPRGKRPELESHLAR